jgi:hypothetical protein
MHAFNCRRLAVLGVVCLLESGFAAGGCAAQSLFAIPTDSPRSAAAADNQPLTITLHVRDPAALARVLGVKPPAGATGVLNYVMNGYPAIQEIAARPWIAPTFVIDYREPSVEHMRAQWVDTLTDKTVQPAQLRDALIKFVAASVQPSHNRGFDIASEVAVHREGDCKQFAIITVALARAAGVPARVVFGLALMRDGITYGAFGHAWAELQIEGRWVVADAALSKIDNPVRYLPFGVLENEGMGYALEIARLTPVWVQRVEVLGNSPTETTLN